MVAECSDRVRTGNFRDANNDAGTATLKMPRRPGDMNKVFVLLSSCERLEEMEENEKRARLKKEAIL
jgi:hypothetical protein